MEKEVSDVSIRLLDMLYNKKNKDKKVDVNLEVEKISKHVSNIELEEEYEEI